MGYILNVAILKIFHFLRAVTMKNRVLTGDPAASITHSEDGSTTVPGNVHFCHITNCYMPEVPRGVNKITAKH